MENLSNNYWVKVLVILIALISPFACILFLGELESYSQYWSTECRPLFIFTNAATSYFLFSMRNWWIPSLSLMLLTAFSYDQYIFIHNITAISFFLFCGISILRSKRLSLYIIPYLFSLLVLFNYGILWGEISGIVVICLFNLHQIFRYLLTIKKRKINKTI